LNPWKWTGTQEGLDYEFKGFITENNGSKNRGGELKLQGILTLVDSYVGDGGFCCVPGFHKHLKKWCERTGHSRYAEKTATNFGFVNVPKGEVINEQVQKISSRAGSLVVWSSELPHCNYPNDSNRFRINQYIKMMPAQEGGAGTDIRRGMMMEYTNDVEVSPLGRKVLGLENWHEGEEKVY